MDVTIVDVAKAFDEFKAANDARLKEIEKKGSADVLTEDKVKRINEALDAGEKKNAELTQKLLAAQTQLDAVEAKLNRPGAGGRADEREDAERKAFGMWLRKGEKTPETEVKVLRVSDDTAGGYLAPMEYVREITKAVVEFSPARSLVRVRQTSQKAVQIPKRTGTFSAAWVSEIGTRSENTGLAYGMSEIPTHELTAEVYISFAELEDAAFDMENEIAMEMAEQFGVAEGTALVTGNGVGKPYGFMSDSLVGTTNSGSSSGVTADGLLNLFHAIKTAYSRNGTWVFNRNTLGSIRKLKDGNGNYLWQMGIAQNQPNTINGAPYVELPDMADEASSAKPVAFGDFNRAYVLVDRLAMAMLRDPYTKASVGQVKFVARRRLGGQVVLAEAIRTLTCA